MPTPRSNALRQRVSLGYRKLAFWRHPMSAFSRRLSRNQFPRFSGSSVNKRLNRFNSSYGARKIFDLMPQRDVISLEFDNGGLLEVLKLLNGPQDTVLWKSD